MQILPKRASTDKAFFMLTMANQFYGCQGGIIDIQFTSYLPKSFNKRHPEHSIKITFLKGL